MSDLGDSLVFAVGISSYDLPGNWQLPNAAEHALAFARWAHTRGVKAARIHLFLSSADIARLQAQITKAGLTARPATYAEVSSFALLKLPELSGELLYMFWSGHGSMSGDGRRVLFYEDLSAKTQLPFDLNGFLMRMRSSSAERFARQLAFIDACANRLEELGFDASAGTVMAGIGTRSLEGVKQQFFLAANAGEQAIAGAFGAAVLKALTEASRARPTEWPVDQDAIVAAVKPQFAQSQHPVELAWTTADGDEYGEQRAGELPASDFVNAAAYSRKIPVRAVRRLAKIALSYAELDAAAGAPQRADLYARLAVAANRPQVFPLRPSTPRVEMLHIVGAAWQWEKEDWLAASLGQIAPSAEFQYEIQRILLIRAARTIVDRLQTATLDDIRAEYQKTMTRLGQEPARQRATTIDAMLDELYQTSSGGDPQRVWEFLLRLADRFPAHRDTIDAFIKANDVPEVTLNTLRAELNAEQLFVLSFNLIPAGGMKPAIKELRALLVVEGTTIVKHRFDPVGVTTWESIEEKAAEIIHAAREIVMFSYRRTEDALLVEFLMPAPFLQQAAESLPLEVDYRRRALGVVHPVVVRLRERTTEPHRAFNVDLWAQVGKRVQRDLPGTIHWARKAKEIPSIDACTGIIALQFLPGESVIDIIDEGFPFMAWLRGDPNADGWTEFVTSFEKWAEASNLRELARNVRAIRRNAPMREVGLTLFWDDPEQTRPSFQMDDVSVGGNR